ncbi:hypothetical protein CkaCkLH20_05818 [Colletotrichum karsti]|uniref:AB hydrolase-1 domain-containing protein n=1 Tax=Colletotrichum karsti TaxID=1095194 RepID=A0A9P6I4V3_9PEZI|nr:uncharacterized protein CkaCkLH20_05818 [Colletotrichum karsti]KAF9876972.1 hypothetical protein CkaCkLH20_05818 [Colletotrichum karsti]
MIGRTLHEYVFIRICIALLQWPIVPYALVLAACVLGAKVTSPDPRWSVASFVVVGLMAVELAYALFIWIPYRSRLGEAAKHPAPSSPAARRALFDRCMTTVPNPEFYLRGWFLGAELGDIRRDNVREFILWAFFDQEASDGNSEVDEEVDQYITHIEQLLGESFQPGRGPAQSLRLTFDEIETKYRSIWWYAIIGLIDGLTHILLVFNGFKYYAQPRNETFAVFPPRFQQLFARRRSPVGLSYWHLPHENSERLPVVFIHGIGIGLWVYIRFLAEINAARRKGEGRVGVIALEILPISFRLTKPPLDRDAFLQQFTEILDRHSWNKFVLVSHSYGSVLTSHIVRCPELQARIPRAVLIDPVSILLHLPDVAFNFTRRQPKRANEWQLWYFASTDPGVAHCLGRCFFWRENAIWAEELVGRHARSEHANNTCQLTADEQTGTRQVTVCLSGQDLIVDSHAVARYLAENEHKTNPAGAQDEQTGVGRQGRRNVAGIPDSGNEHRRSVGSGIDVLWFPRRDHAQVFDSKCDRGRIVDVVRKYCKT